MIAAERFARAQHEFQFIHEELEKFEGQLQPMMSEWSAQLAGSAAAPQTWHARQFKDAIECLLQIQMRFDKMTLPKEVDPSWFGSDGEYEGFPTQPQARQMRKDMIRRCEQGIERLQALHDGFKQRFSGTQRADNWRSPYSAIGNRQATPFEFRLQGMAAPAAAAAAKSPAPASAAAGVRSAGGAAAAAPKVGAGVAGAPGNSKACSWCGATHSKLRKCPCGQVRYCNEECQLKHWTTHADVCTVAS